MCTLCMPVSFLVQRHPIYTHLCSGNKEFLAKGTVGEVVLWERLIPTEPLRDTPWQGEAPQYPTDN